MVQICSCFVFKLECYAVWRWTEIQSGMLPNDFEGMDGLAKVDLSTAKEQNGSQLSCSAKEEFEWDAGWR